MPQGGVVVKASVLGRIPALPLTACMTRGDLSVSVASSTEEGSSSTCFIGLCWKDQNRSFM